MVRGKNLSIATRLFYAGRRLTDAGPGLSVAKVALLAGCIGPAVHAGRRTPAAVAEHSAPVGHRPTRCARTKFAPAFTDSRRDSAERRGPPQMRRPALATRVQRQALAGATALRALLAIAALAAAGAPAAPRCSRAASTGAAARVAAVVTWTRGGRGSRGCGAGGGCLQRLLRGGSEEAVDGRVREEGEDGLVDRIRVLTQSLKRCAQCVCVCVCVCVCMCVCVCVRICV